MDAARILRADERTLRGNIARLYETAAEDMAGKAAASRSGSLTERFAWELTQSLRERTRELWADVGSLTKSGMRRAAERAAGVQLSFLEDAAGLAGLDLGSSLRRTFAHTRDDAVTGVLRGGVYGGNAPMLSKRIWNNAALQNGQIEQLIAQAVAKGESPVKLAKALQAYVNPQEAEPSNWNDIYDIPFAHKVDYNAKRLAVTSIRHAAWSATIAAARENPYAKYIHWELTPAHVIHDICDAHAVHEEGLGEGNFSIDAAPLPHPFCTCLYFADTDQSLDEIARELRGWADGEREDARMDALVGGRAGSHVKRGEGISDDATGNNPTHVLQDYVARANPGMGTVHIPPAYDADRHRAEMAAGQWIVETFGGTVEMLNESVEPGVKTADFLWNGKPWELKTVRSARAADSALRKALKQLKGEAGGVLIDCAYADVNLRALEAAIDSRMRRGFQQDTDIMIKREREILQALRYTKNAGTHDAGRFETGHPQTNTGKGTSLPSL